jgi:palmitoyltransferase
MLNFPRFQTYQKSQMNLIGMSRLNRDEDNTEMGASTTVLLSEKEDSADDADDKCPVCRQAVPGRTTHCQYCNLCVIRQDHHSLWVNCCIGRFNHKFYIFGCVFAILASLLFANLTMTSVCHPFPLVQILSVLVLLPDDCSDVYHQYDIALCFVASIYALMLAVGILLNLIQQVRFLE